MRRIVKNYLSGIAVAVMLFTNGNAYGQKAWSLQECVAYALENNISVKQNEISSSLAEMSMQQNRFSMLPTLNASAGRNWNFGRTIDPNTNTFTTQQVESDNISLNSNVTLFNGFQLQNTLKQSRLDYMASKSDIDKIKNDYAPKMTQSQLPCNSLRRF
jgi:outer membrane protein